MDGSFKARQIREEPSFEADKKALKKSAKRLDEALSGITWIMVNNPSLFFNIPDTSLWLAKTDAAPQMPALLVWFTFDDEIVHLQHIEKKPKTNH